MKSNMGAADKAIRIVLAIVFAGLYITKLVEGTVGLALLVIGGVFLLTYYPDGLINGQSGGMAVVTNTGFALIGSPLLAPVGGITFVINTPTLACTLTSGLTVGCILSVIQIG